MPGLPLVSFSLVLLSTAWAGTTLNEVSSTTLEEGVVLTQYRAASPSTDVWVLRVDLCADNVYVDATREAVDYQTTGSWAQDWEMTAATNGDFYQTDPVRVYGDAVGGGVRWPEAYTGVDEADADEWFWEHSGWIAFGHDEVWVNHTGWVKENVAELTMGVDNADLTPPPPPGVLALVSGFPEVVVEGVPMVCADPEDSDCFPDRSDMRDRHPRTAMGISEDMSTFLLLVADGRTSDNDGLYGSELADIMGQLGAWDAFNLDGGGSSQLWTESGGYENDYDGNNYGNGARTIANHWGIFAGGRDYLAARPGHCGSAPACGTLGPGGGVIDDTDACFRGFGDQVYWRDVAEGYGGGLQWTNAFDSDTADNWAWWRVALEEAGEYEVLIYANADYSVFDDVEYEVRASGVSTSLRVDPAGKEGWVSIGTWSFASGGDQWVAFFDDQASNPGSDQHIVADAVQLVRVGDWCGDAACATAERCACEEDCPLVDEVAGNSVDDDCDGEFDEVDAPDGETEGTNGPGTAMRFSDLGDDCGCSSRGGGSYVSMGLAFLVARARRRG